VLQPTANIQNERAKKLRFLTLTLLVQTVSYNDRRFALNARWQVSQISVPEYASVT
jgi:hypothetical protein